MYHLQYTNQLEEALAFRSTVCPLQFLRNFVPRNGLFGKTENDQFPIRVGEGVL